jgi:formamidopyrimidine-DNA glycosylase
MWILNGLGAERAPLEERLRSATSSQAEPWLLVHLGMSGQFTVVSAYEPRLVHTHVIFTLDDGRQLRFRDPRRFGSVTYYPERDALEQFFAKTGLGPEPFAVEAKTWHRSVSSSKRNLKAILLDQNLVAGVGNIYADEALFDAKLHPATQGKDLSLREAERLLRAVVSVLNRAIESRGSTIRNYVGGSGLKGGFQERFSVYGRTDEPCPRCGTPIERLVLGGRSSHFCPKCQVKRT